MSMAMGPSRNGPGRSPSAGNGAADKSPNRSASIPLPMLLLVGTLWILTIISFRFGLPWGNVAFTSSYGGTLLFCYFLTGLTTIKALKRTSRWSRLGEMYSGQADLAGSCSTCETFFELTDGFSDIPPKVEAIYVEHLSREHEMEP